MGYSEKMAEEDHDIVQEVDSWTKPKAKISWISPTGTLRTTGRRRFENKISELNNPK